MATRIKRKVKTSAIVKPSKLIATNGVELKSVYCRKCCRTKPPASFFAATDLYLDTNTKMSVCKECIDEIFDKIYASERVLDKTIYRMCKMLNVRYDDLALQATIEKFSADTSKDKDVKNVFGIYKQNIVRMGRTKVDDSSDSIDLTFYDVQPNFVDNPIDDDHVDAVDLKQIWGINYNYDDYVFLEAELRGWRKTHKSDTKAEEELLKMLCHKALEIKKSRETGASTSALEKQYQDLMKTANVDPAKTALAGSGKAQDTFSAFIKTIEENEPADYYKDKALFKDFDNIDFYFKKYILRPLKNFVTQSRDFNVEIDSDEDDFDEVDVDAILNKED